MYLRITQLLNLSKCWVIHIFYLSYRRDSGLSLSACTDPVPTISCTIYLSLDRRRSSYVGWLTVRLGVYCLLLVSRCLLRLAGRSSVCSSAVESDVTPRPVAL